MFRCLEQFLEISQTGETWVFWKRQPQKPIKDHKDTDIKDIFWGHVVAFRAEVSIILTSCAYPHYDLRVSTLPLLGWRNHCPCQDHAEYRTEGRCSHGSTSTCAHHTGLQHIAASWRAPCFIPRIPQARNEGSTLPIINLHHNSCNFCPEVSAGLGSCWVRDRQTCLGKAARYRNRKCDEVVIWYYQDWEMAIINNPKIYT